MDAECYFAEKMMRVRIAEVRANAEVARLLRQSNERPRRSHGLRRTFNVHRPPSIARKRAAEKVREWRPPDAPSGASREPFVVTHLGREMEGVMTTTILQSRPITAPVPLQTAKATRTRRLLEDAIVPTLFRLAAPNILNLVALTVNHGRRLLCRLAWCDGTRRDLARIPARDEDAAHGGERHGWCGHLDDRPGVMKQKAFR